MGLFGGLDIAASGMSAGNSSFGRTDRTPDGDAAASRCNGSPRRRTCVGPGWRKAPA